MPWPIYLALKYLFPTRRKLSVFALISIIGVSLGVAVMLMSQTIVNGFGEQIRQALVDNFGDGRLSRRDEAPWDTSNQLKQLRGHPEVLTAQSYAQDILMLRTSTRTQPATAFGMNFWEKPELIPTGSYLIDGSIHRLGLKTLLLGSELARKLGVVVGSSIEIYTPLMLEQFARDERPLPDSFELIGIFHTGQNAIDANTVWMGLEDMRELYGLNQHAHGLVWKLNPSANSLAFVQKIRPQLPTELKPVSWLEANEGLLFVLAFEKTMTFIFNGLIVAVAAFSIAAGLFATVLRKRRHIGLLGALGAPPWKIASVFCLQGLCIGAAGCGLGTSLTLMLLRYRHGIIEFCMQLNTNSEALLHYYPLLHFPLNYQWSDFILVYGLSIGLTTLAGALPAVYAARLNSTEALAHED